MKQPVRKQVNRESSKKEVKKRKPRSKTAKRKHPLYGTSKLEEDFARNFLDKLGVKYVYQFEAKDIGRFFDFFIPNKDGSYGGLIIEVDGNFWHGDPKLFEGKELGKIQKKSQRVDEYKNKWAYLHGFPIMRIWESDIRKHPKEVMERLKERLYLIDEKNKKKQRNLGQKT